MPSIDVNLFVYNGAATIGASIDSVLGQTWSDLTLTIIDNASTDGTADIAAEYVRRDTRVRLQRNRSNVGPVLNCQRAFWNGGAEFVMPKTADDLLAPDFIAELMRVIADNPDVAMCHAAGLIFDDDGAVKSIYPETHRLNATGSDPVARASHVMAHYTSAPAFWGIYRRTAVEQLASIPYRAGWDHSVLAELALYGEIRSIDQLLFWRRHGGKDVNLLARGCSQYTQRNLPLDDGLAELRWRTPLVTTAYAHIEQFTIARLDGAQRRALMEAVPRIFRARWLPMMRQEAARFDHDFPELLAVALSERGVAAPWALRQLLDALIALETMLPEAGFAERRIETMAMLANLERVA